MENNNIINEQVYFLDLPDEEYAERIGDAIDELMQQGKIAFKIFPEMELTNDEINQVVEFAMNKYDKEKGYN